LTDLPVLQITRWYSFPSTISTKFRGSLGLALFQAGAALIEAGLHVDHAE
jgi:hypothetical protein